MPSDSHINSTSGAFDRKRDNVPSASLRSTPCGFGLSVLTATRAALAGCMEISRVVSDSGSTATPRPSASARPISSSAVRSRASQLDAAPQPSSSRISNGALRLVAATGGFHSGPAAAMITRVASSNRSSVSHHGVRDGVSSLGTISNSNRVGGKSTRRGRGGTSRSSHHSTGRPSKPEQDERLREGEGKAGDHAVAPVFAASALRGMKPICAPALMRAWIANSSSVGPRSVRCTVKVQPN